MSGKFSQREEIIMPGVSKYDKKQTKKVPPSYETVKAKFESENMTIEELTVFLQNSQRENRQYLTEKTVKNYIKVLCESSGGLLRPEDFKENPKSKSPYCIKPAWQGILVTLMDSDFFEGRKNDRRLKTRADLNQQLAENVNKYLTGDDKRIITENPAFINAELEARLSKHINRELVRFADGKIVPRFLSIFNGAPPWYAENTMSGVRPKT